jgi:hypothetical protein
MSKKKENTAKKAVLALLFCCLVILGITLVFKWWAPLTILFK